MTNDFVTGVVVFLFVRDKLLLIKRSESMATHKGEIAFIGGYKKSTESFKGAAMREFIEETSYQMQSYEFLGFLNPVYTLKTTLILPCLYYCFDDEQDFLTSIRSNGEWSDALLIDFKELMMHKYWVKAKIISNMQNSFMHFRPILKGTYLSSTEQSSNNYMLWGATARIIRSFYKNYFLNTQRKL